MLSAGFEPAITINQAATDLRLGLFSHRDQPETVLPSRIFFRPLHLTSPLTSPPNLTRILKMAGAILPPLIIEWDVVEDGYNFT